MFALFTVKCETNEYVDNFIMKGIHFDACKNMIYHQHTELNQLHIAFNQNPKKKMEMNLARKKNC